MKREQKSIEPAVVKTVEGKSVSAPVHMLTNKNEMTKVFWHLQQGPLAFWSLLVHSLILSDFF